MRTDLRVKHDIEARRMATELFEQGHGHRSTAKALRIPRQTVKQWRQIHRALGSEALLTVDGEQARYTYEQKVAAASAVVVCLVKFSFRKRARLSFGFRH